MTKKQYYEQKSGDIVICIDETDKRLILNKYYNIKCKSSNTNSFYINYYDEKCNWFDCELFETLVESRNMKINKIIK